MLGEQDTALRIASRVFLPDAANVEDPVVRTIEWISALLMHRLDQLMLLLPPTIPHTRLLYPGSQVMSTKREKALISWQHSLVNGEDG